jgi:hypothetical protein
MRAHSVQYFRIIPSGVSKLKISVDIARLPGVFVHQGLAMGLALDSGLPMGYDYFANDVWQRTSLSLDNPVAGKTYYLVVIAGVQGYDTPYYTREQTCQEAVEYLESTAALNIVLSVSGNTDDTQLCSGAGSCDFQSTMGGCSCQAGYQRDGSKCVTVVASNAAVIGLAVTLGIVALAAVFLAVRLRQVSKRQDTYTSDMQHMPLNDS